MIQADGAKRDGVHGMVDREQMDPAARKLRDVYAITPGMPFIQREFGFYSVEKWQREEGMPTDVPLRELFGFEAGGMYPMANLGWTEADFYPSFEEKILEDRGAHEVVQDKAGRGVLYFKGKRSGFMPEYIDHPVKDMKTWEENVKWRLDPTTKERQAAIQKRIPGGIEKAAQGHMISQGMIGGYMYLRSLIGPEDLFYKFYDEPELIHDCMQTWLTLADAVTAEFQKHITYDELFFGEDICYNGGILISPDMMREFLVPYYQQLISNMKSRQLDPTRHMYIQIDTDGDTNPAIPVYQEIGMDVMSPFEVASGCDVVEIGKQYPDLVIFGGFDKRILARGPAAIDAEVDRIFPVMRARGGYIPTCDHGVPEEVLYKDYLHYRKRCEEFAE